MVGVPTNPVSGLDLAKSMDSRALQPANNLADLPDRVAASTVVNGHRGNTVTVTAVAGATNVSTVTVTVKDLAGNTVPGVHWLDLITTSDAAGTTISGTAYSGTLVATTGTILVTPVAKHAFLIATDATGVFIGSLTDTAKTADFVAVKKPVSGGIIVSSAMAFG